MKRILLAEDEENIADFVCRGLESFGFDVDRARRGDEAWTKLQHGDYDLALLDIRMPGMTGLEVCSHLREERGYAASGTDAHGLRYHRRHRPRSAGGCRRLYGETV